VVPLSRFTTGSPDEPTTPGLTQGKSLALTFGLGFIALFGSGLPLQAATLLATETGATEIASTESASPEIANAEIASREIVATGSDVTEQLEPEQEAIGSIAIKTTVSDVPANQTPDKITWRPDTDHVRILFCSVLPLDGEIMILYHLRSSFFLSSFFFEKIRETLFLIKCILS
jgi:hypothetical protein